MDEKYKKEVIMHINFDNMDKIKELGQISKLDMETLKIAMTQLTDWEMSQLCRILKTCIQ